MKRGYSTIVLLALALAMVGTLALAAIAEARAGGSRSIGSRGSRSYSRPVSPSTQPSPYRQATPSPAPTPSPFQQPQPAGGGFLRSMAGGLVGGMLGGMLFRSLGFGGGMGGGFGGSGIGLFEIALIGGLCYLIYRMVRSRRQEASATRTPSSFQDYQQSTQTSYQDAAPAQETRIDDVATGLAHVRQMDATFDAGRFPDIAMDLFFKIQGAWMHRDLVPVADYLTDEMRRVLQGDIDQLKRDGRVNRLENIAVRDVTIVEAWQEGGQDFLTTLIYANLLDYTTDEAGNVVTGSKTDPVKFEEYWTFSRPVGPNAWKLAAIDQKA